MSFFTQAEAQVVFFFEKEKKTITIKQVQEHIYNYALSLQTVLSQHKVKIKSFNHVTNKIYNKHILEHVQS